MSVKCGECGSPLEWTVWGVRPISRDDARIERLERAAREAFIECHDREFWSNDSYQMHEREWTDCQDPLCTERRAALEGGAS